MNRVWHPYDKWECYKSGFFSSKNPNKLSNKEAEKIYYTFLRDLNAFERTLKAIITEWPYSCEHNLTNESLNRIAWLGQASLAYEYKIPSHNRGGFNLLSPEEQSAANLLAEKYLNIWISQYKEKTDVNSEKV